MKFVDVIDINGVMFLLNVEEICLVGTEEEYIPYIRNNNSSCLYHKIITFNGEEFYTSPDNYKLFKKRRISE